MDVDIVLDPELEFSLESYDIPCVSEISRNGIPSCGGSGNK